MKNKFQKYLDEETVSGDIASVDTVLDLSKKKVQEVDKDSDIVPYKEMKVRYPRDLK